MNKKIISSLLALVMLSSLFTGLGMTAMAAETEHVVNGGFEEYTNDEIAGWSTSGATIGKEILTGDYTAHRGKSGVGLIPRGNGLYVAQTINTLVPGEKYTFSAWLKVVVMDGYGAEVKLQLTGAPSIVKNFAKKDANNEWTNITFDFVYPESAVSCFLLVRNTTKEGALYWDEVSIKGAGEGTASTPSANPDKPASTEEELQNAEEHVLNGGFENFTAEKITSWGERGGEIGKEIITGASTAHDGKSGIGLIPSGAPLYVQWNSSRYFYLENTLSDNYITFLFYRQYL